MDNARALFERALTAATAEGAPQLWDRFLAFEYEHGSLPAALAVQVPKPVIQFIRTHRGSPMLRSGTISDLRLKFCGTDGHLPAAHNSLHSQIELDGRTQSTVCPVIWAQTSHSVRAAQERRAEAQAEAAGDGATATAPPPGDVVHVALLKYRCANFQVQVCTTEIEPEKPKQGRVRRALHSSCAARL